MNIYTRSAVLAASVLVFTPLVRGDEPTPTEKKLTQEIEALRKENAALRQQLEEQKQLAQANGRKAREAVDLMLRKLGEDKLPEPKLDAMRQKLLENARKYYEEFAEKSGMPEEKLQLAHAQLKLGLMQQQLGKPTEAVEAYRKSIAMLRELVTKSPDNNEARADLARAHVGLGHVLSDQGRMAEALQCI